MPNKRKRPDSRVLIKNARDKLMPKPTTELDKTRNEAILQRQHELEKILDQHESKVKELYHLEMYQNMLDFDPKKNLVNDLIYQKFIQDFNLWDIAYNTSQHKNTVQLLESVFNSTKQAATAAASSNYQTIRSGTGTRRLIKQYKKLNDYLSTFVTATDDEEMTPEAREALIEKERGIRQRLDQLYQAGGFTTQLQAIAHRRPHQPPRQHDLFHDTLLAHVQSSAKLFAANSKYRRNMARKCARAVERYWENIWAQDERAKKEETKRLVRLAKVVAQEVKKKWKIVEKVCEARQKELSKEAQAKEGRRHLELILEHSHHVLGMRREELDKQQEGLDEEYVYTDEENLSDHIIEHNDEESDEDELHELENDQSMSVEELVKKYQEHSDGEFTQTQAEDDVPIESDGMSDDDDEEINDLNEDAQLSVEELMKKYNYAEPTDDHAEFTPGSDQEEDIPLENDGESEDDEAEINALNEDADLPIDQLLQKYNYSAQDNVIQLNGEKEIPLSALMDTEFAGEQPRETKDTTLSPASPSSSDISSTRTRRSLRKIQPTGNTLLTTKVRTKIPFLLRGTLREYQHVGLDWLASLYNNGLNGILADEMGLGKTIQTIALLAYLACEKRVWGPHLIVVPTSVILNWEMEFKKWLPGFKVLTYYGSPKERKEKRSGWYKPNAFHVCITSYQLVLQDQNVFRRRAWQYLVLDEAHNIKNFRSQRWQVLLNFNANRRLLLTGTPLQNNLMELWSLLYFLMPNGVSQDMPIGFANLKEFQEWFSHPVDRMIEGQQGMDEESRAAIQKLHTVLRPYLLRRVKADVEKQMPEKHEHVVYCKLSKRQRFLYDDFMSRAKTKETLASGNFLNIINCLMQLRKVCNHPDLFEERPILTSFAMGDEVQTEGSYLESLIRRRFNVVQPMERVNFDFLNLILQHPHMNQMSQIVANEIIRLAATEAISKVIANRQRHIAAAEARGIVSKDYHDLKKYAKYREMQMQIQCMKRWESIQYVNSMRCARKPFFGSDLVTLLRSMTNDYRDRLFSSSARMYMSQCDAIREMVQGYKERIYSNLDILEQYGCVTPKAVVWPKERILPYEGQLQLQQANSVDNDIFHPIRSRLSIAFPDKWLIQYDCGKLQKLDKLLRELAAGGHRALIFTQMTRVLDILETFLNIHGYRYLRLDGATKVEQRQILTEHFNSDKRILCFILSTRSGGLGINLTGADTVIFYDLDWNPSMDKQCQDRAHRIGQTRDVHIYRFVTEYTIEENIFKKANQKRMLDNVVIQEGDFTADFFNKTDWWRELPEVVGASERSVYTPIDYEQALLEAEGDETDAQAAMVARKEMNMDDNDFNDTSSAVTRQSSEAPSQAPSQTVSQASQTEEDPTMDGDVELNVGHVDQYMLRFWEREMLGIDLGFGGFANE
ncbi:hypothetical protein BCV71DRAFT_188674 [Rhizopus microsporus]|uniref:Helicase SWR1 n=1 Tax=Rhizopus microsporus TaxID=58291 RepID=A0A1X0RNT4_RHIZD|nr:hypothetical protein BCV71DRAFT_188674 [Rhizopus microsporus]